MLSLRSAGLLALSNVLLLIAIITFAIGFYPHKSTLSGIARATDSDQLDFADSPFDKLIFVVVDALRSDFVYSVGSGFEFTQRLIREGAALPFTAQAASPTITLPRIKALTTGSVPSFLDAVLNFAESDTSSSLAMQDTWLAQMKAKGTGKMVMYGDDTWLKLFPGFFDRAEGTTSFFVSDFTEVDSNVTRHVETELVSNDWNTLILHFLGLDHIGHKTGSRSVHMHPKQKEMDTLVQRIVVAQETHRHLSSALFVLCGDHGMTEGGNHGGSSSSETSTAMLLISPKFRSYGNGTDSPLAFRDDFKYHVETGQSDIIPSLAAMLGFSIPKNSLGILIPEILPLWPWKQHVPMLMRNAKQVHGVLGQTFPDLAAQAYTEQCRSMDSSSRNLGCIWSVIDQTTNTPPSTELESLRQQQMILKFLRQAQKVLTATATDYSVGTLITALGLGFLAAPLAMINAGLSVSRVWLSVISMISVLHSLTMLGSSFVEEEHQFWYWGTTSVVILLWACLYRYHHEASSARRGLFAVAIIALLLRIFRRWNQTGQKWITEPDIKKVLLVGRPSVLWTMVIYTYIDVALRMSNHGFQALGNEFAVIAALSITTAALGFKFSHTMNDAPELIKGCPSFLINIYDSIPLSSQAQTVFFFLIAAALYTFGADLWAKVRNGHASHHHGVDQMGHDLLTVFLITQSRLTNIPVFLLFRVMSLLIRALFRNDPSAGGMSCLILIMQQVSFFALGGSNAISSVDLSNAYNGITNYNAFGVGLLTFVSNWAGPIWWTSECVLQLSMQNRARTSRAASKILETGAEPSWEAWVVFANLATVFTSLTAVGTMIACLLLRHHLFVWTVFSPKYLYVIAWGIPMHLGINLGLGSFMYWLESLKDREERSEPILAS